MYPKHDWVNARLSNPFSTQQPINMGEWQDNKVLRHALFKKMIKKRKTHKSMATSYLASVFFPQQLFKKCPIHSTFLLESQNICNDDGPHSAFQWVRKVAKFVPQLCEPDLEGLFPHK